MQTSFTSQQLQLQKLQEANDILRSCVHCGFCTATCPTYKILGDERDSPRGRIYLIKEMLESGRPADQQVQQHMDKCLSCLSCMTTCPSGVDYMHLADIARQHIEQTGNRPLKEKLMRSLLAHTLPYPGRLRLALLFSRLAKPFTGWFSKLGLHEMRAMLELAPKNLPKKSAAKSRQKHLVSDLAPSGVRTKRVAMLEGCVQQVVRPSINEATTRLLTRLGVEIISLRGAACCGAMALHMGREEEAKKLARQNLDVWYPEENNQALDALVITASGCGTVIKDYGHLLASDDVYAKRSNELSGLTVDITEFIDQFDFKAVVDTAAIRVAYHSACSLKHGQRVIEQPLNLLNKAGFEVVEPLESHICCGSAGTYNILQPDLARQLRDRKLNHITSLEPDIIATGNIGCLTQLASGANIPVLHTAELLDWATGGPCPEDLKVVLERKANEQPAMQEAGLTLENQSAKHA